MSDGQAQVGDAGLEVLLEVGDRRRQVAAVGRTEALEGLAVELLARGLSVRDIKDAFRDESGRLLLSRTAEELRRLTRSSRHAKQFRRLLALAVIRDGGSRTEAARTGGTGRQIVRDRVVRFNAEGPTGLIGRKAPGKTPLPSGEHRAALARVVEAGPKPCLDGVVRWRLIDLAQWLRDEFRVSASETSVGRELRAMGFRKLSARPRHCAQDSDAIEAFKKRLPARVADIREKRVSGKRIELWFQGEPDQQTVRGAVFPANARIGQKNRITRRWARRGTRPRVPHDQRMKWTYIFGAICPAEGKGAGLVMPWCDTEAMQAHPVGISTMVAPDAHAVLILDQAGWHYSGSLDVPASISLLPLPPRSPELNPVENVRRFLRDNQLSNRVFKSYDDIVAHCCEAWNDLMDQPWRIKSIGRREWVHGFSSMRVGITRGIPKAEKV